MPVRLDGTFEGGPCKQMGVLGSECFRVDHWRDSIQAGKSHQGQAFRRLTEIPVNDAAAASDEHF